MSHFETMKQEMDAILGEPHPYRAFLHLEEYYRLADAEERAAIRARWPFERRWFIPGLDYSDYDQIAFRPLIGEDAFGLDAEARIEASLTYHAIENAQSDFRDTGLDICLTYHAALTAGLDVISLFEEAAEISEPWIAGLLRHLITGSPEGRSLWPMGIRQITGDNEIVFEWIGFADDYDSLKPTHLDAWGRE